MKVRHIYISPAHTYFGRHGQVPGQTPMIEVRKIECLAGRGIRGDRFLDFNENYRGQITFFSWEVFEAMCRELKLAGQSPGAARRNVVVSGADLNSLARREFSVQGVSFLGIEPCAPCYWMDQAFAPGAEQFLKGRGGLRAQILTDGRLYTDCS